MARRWRRTKWTAVAVIGALGITAATGPTASGAPAQSEEIAPGYGNALAYGVRLNPTTAQLSLAITNGISLASHQNTVATAESRAIDLGIIGTTLGAEQCDGDDPTLPKEDQPQPLRTTSNEEGASEGFTEQEDTPPGAPVTKFVRAESTPFAEAITTTAPAGEPAAIAFSGVRTTSTSGLVDGRREARAVTEIAELVLGGAVRLTGLRWEAVHRSGAAEELTGSFTIGTASINGEPIPTNDPAEAIAAVNQVLNPIGLNLRPPTSRSAPGPNGNIQFVDPLALQVVPNPTRDGITGPILEGLQPARESLFQAFLDATCDAATYITVFDIVLGSLTGAGSFNVEFGGVQAETRAIRFSSSLGGRPTLGLGNNASLGGASVGAGGANRGATSAVGRTATPAPQTGAGTGGGAAQPSAGGDAPSGLAEPIADVAGERGGALALVGSTGLLLLLASAEADRRKMRRAQREIPVGV